MHILFTCPHCGTQTEVFEEYAGQSGPCGVCGHMITVPLPAGPPAQAEVTGEGPGQPAKRSGRERLSLVLLSLGASLLGIGILVGLIVAIVWPVVGRLRQDSQHSAARANLRRIASAMQAYVDDYDAYPPPFVADQDGNPVHSWRVLLLPYLGHEDLYRQYTFEEPWDSPNNMAVAWQMPAVFACAADDEALSQSETSFMVIVGDATLFPESGTVRPEDVSDGPEETILLVQTRSCGVCWLAPTDLKFDSMQFLINGTEGREITSYLPGGAYVASADGRVFFLPDETPPDVLRAAATRNGGDLAVWREFAER